MRFHFKTVLPPDGVSSRGSRWPRRVGVLAAVVVVVLAATAGPVWIPWLTRSDGGVSRASAGTSALAEHPPLGGVTVVGPTDLAWLSRGQSSGELTFCIGYSATHVTANASARDVSWAECGPVVTVAAKFPAVRVVPAKPPAPLRITGVVPERVDRVVSSGVVSADATLSSPQAGYRVFSVLIAQEHASLVQVITRLKVRALDQAGDVVASCRSSGCTGGERASVEPSSPATDGQTDH